MFKHGSLCSGIGGFDIAATWMGWENVFSCEKHPFCQRILKYYWPKTKHYEDIYGFNAAIFRGGVDIITGGFPCQPFSQAGKRRGKADDRYLFPQVCRIIREARPKWIVLENVAGLFSILEPGSLSEMEIKAVELFCQDGEQQTNSTIIRLQRRVIGSIISEISAAGYVLPALKDGTPVVLCIPAAAVNAPHQRDRVWFVAHADSHGNDPDRSYSYDHQTGAQTQRTKEPGRQRRTGIFDGFSDLSDLHGSIEFQSGGAFRYAQFNINPAYSGTAYPPDPEPWWTSVPSWDSWPTQPAFCGGNDGLPRKLDGITFSKWRSESVKAYGNAIVPQLALQIFKVIETVEHNPLIYPL